MAAAVAQQCQRVRIALLGQLLPILNPVRAAEEIGMLDNLTEGRLVVAFMRGTLSEDQVYDLNPNEGRDKLLEGMDLVLRALTEPQPFSWEGRYYNYRTVSVWPKPVQWPMPPTIVATRSEDTIKYAADNQLGLGIAYETVENTVSIVDKYHYWCAQAGWWPSSDYIVYRGGICLSENDSEVEEFLNGRRARGVERGLSISSSLAQAVLAARNGARYDSRADSEPPASAARPPRAQLNFVGGPETVFRQIEELHRRSGVGVVDLAFQQPAMSHEGVMEQLELFGRRVLPRVKELGEE
jgi:alkanesulfonate monooxygenase SsuD/methylene tetrahydromethanopterin reductase-like flavin-dependent oxidoreductase (luciferase family)